MGGDAVLIPNGVDCSTLRRRRAAARLAGRRAARCSSSAAWTSRARGCRCCSRRCPAIAARTRACACSSPARATSRTCRERARPPSCADRVTFLGLVSRGRQGAGLRLGRRLRRAQHRRRELRHRAARGDGVRHARPGQRPRGVPPRPRRRPRRGACSPTRTRPTSPAPRSSCSTTPRAARALAREGLRQARASTTGRRVAKRVVEVYDARDGRPARRSARTSAASWSGRLARRRGGAE